MSRDRLILETERLILRCPSDRDIPAIIAMAGNLEVSRRLSGIPHPYSEADARFFLDEVVFDGWTWGITLKPSDTLIGIVGLTPEADSHIAELGYYIDRRHWGRGIATEAAQRVIHHGLTTLNLRQIISDHFINNPASGRVLAKLGFTRIGKDKRPCLATGTIEPSANLLLRVQPPAPRHGTTKDNRGHVTQSPQQRRSHHA